MNQLLKECALDEECSYLDGENQTTHYKIIEQCSQERCEELVERGWRRFGNMFFRPICHECTACESLKIDVANYILSRSAKRVMRKNSSLRAVIQRPTVTREHLDIFRRYHDHMGAKRGWKTQSINARNYHISFVHGYNSFGYEVLYYDGEKLIAVDLIDVLSNGISSIYFYYDPEYADRSLGHYSLYRQILTAQEQGLSWIYLGYHVEGCQSLSYKKNYTPSFKLESRPLADEKPLWMPYEPIRKPALTV